MHKERLHNSIGKVIKREFVRITERKTLYLLSIIVPFIVAIILFVIFKNPVLRDIPVAIYDEDHSELSQLITRYIESTRSMEIVTYANSLEELKKDFRTDKVSAAFHFPQGMEATIKDGKQSNVELFMNTMNLVKSNTVMKDGSTIIKTISGGAFLQKLRSTGMMENQAMDLVNPIQIETKILFNPGYSYLVYLVPALVTFAFHMAVFMASVLLISAEFTEKTFSNLLETADNKIPAIIIGKAVPHLTIQLMNIIILMGIFYPLFGINIAGSVLTAILFTFFFLIVVFFFGLMISSLFHDSMFSTELALFLTTPAFIFSGLTYPLRIMPEIHSTYAQLMPYTHFIEGFVKIYQMGVPIQYLAPQFLRLSIFIIISVIVTIFALKYNIKKYGLSPEKIK
ncbi:MAG: ABC transporter permease [Ignavibacteriaceae bacterium]|jgi:ABC-2 type transport system permease protein